MNSREDKGQAFSGVSRSANPVTSRHIHKGGNQPEDEPVGLKSIDEPRDRGLNENAMPGSEHGHDPSSFGEEGGGKVERDGAPFTIPRDSAGTDAPDFSLMESQLKYEWGREVPELTCCRWEEFAENPGYKIELPSANNIQHNPGMGPTMDEFKAGSLHSGSKNGPAVKNRAQAIAIGLSEQRRGK